MIIISKNVYVCLCVCMYVCIYIYIHIQWHAKVWKPLAENVNNFKKIIEIIQNACYFLFSTVLSKISYIKDVYI